MPRVAGLENPGRRSVTGLLLAAPFAATACSAGSAASKSNAGSFTFSKGITTSEPLVAPKGRRIKVAFAINPGVQVIDLAGPWETFQDTYLSPQAPEPAFEMFTVSDRQRAFRGSGGLMITPDYAVDNAPVPDVVVVPHFDQPSPTDPAEISAIHQWIRHSHERALLTMSICTGAFQLAKIGLLDAIPMTTNRLASDNFAKTFPKIDLRRGPRFVEVGRIATAGGLSAGIDLALRVVSRFHGAEVAQSTASRMEYAGVGWRA